MTRPMGQFHVEQRTKDGYFNATSFVKQWNLHTQNSGDVKKKEIKEYLENKSTQEFLSALIKEENLDGGNSPYVTSKARADRGGGTWMHPIMFIDFAMWLNPAFKVKVIKFVYDQMLKYRNDAGDAYKELSSSIKMIVPNTFMPQAMRKIGEALNYVVFNEHETMLRNKKGSEESMRELFELERRLAENINDGLIKDFEQAITFLRRRYANKYYPKVFKS
jgi:antitoxin component of MazEF toxin-antitoxin module